MGSDFFVVNCQIISSLSSGTTTVLGHSPQFGSSMPLPSPSGGGLDGEQSVFGQQKHRGLRSRSSEKDDLRFNGCEVQVGVMTMSSPEMPQS